MIFIACLFSQHHYVRWDLFGCKFDEPFVWWEIYFLWKRLPNLQKKNCCRTFSQTIQIYPSQHQIKSDHERALNTKGHIKSHQQADTHNHTASPAASLICHSITTSFLWHVISAIVTSEACWMFARLETEFVVIVFEFQLDWTLCLETFHSTFQLAAAAVVNESRAQTYTHQFPIRKSFIKLVAAQILGTLLNDDIYATTTTTVAFGSTLTSPSKRFPSSFHQHWQQREVSWYRVDAFATTMFVKYGWNFSWFR